MKIWVISELYYPDEAATGHYMTQIAEGLALRGPVNVICSQPHYFAPGSRALAHEVHNGVYIERCRATTLDKNKFLFKLVNGLSASLSIFMMALARIGTGDVALVVTNPPLLPFVVALVCRLRGARCVLRIDDVYPEAMINAGLIRSNHSLARVLNGLTRRLYQSVDRIVVLGRDMQRLVARKMTHGQDRIVVITNWADVESVTPTPRAQNALLHELGLTAKFVVGYAGNMGPLQGIDSLFQAALRLAGTGDIHFLFVGSGRQSPWLIQAAREAGLANLTVVGQRPRSDEANFLNACDVAIVSLVPGMAGVGVPSRMYNMMAAGKPIIAVAEDDAEPALVVRQEEIGWVVPPGQPGKIADAILEAQAHPDRLVEMGASARRAAEARYTFDQAIQAYLALVAEVGLPCSLHSRPP
jgi:colanic acid biosynthesis glycosyl transferase WcaI